MLTSRSRKVNPFSQTGLSYLKVKQFVAITRAYEIIPIKEKTIPIAINKMIAVAGILDDPVLAVDKPGWGLWNNTCEAKIPTEIETMITIPRSNHPIILLGKENAFESLSAITASLI
jgi:hypothetical protein